MESRRVLVTGATGYVGGRLLRALEERGILARCLTRHPENLEARVSAQTEVVAGDVADPDSLKPALEGCSTAYYLIHSMGATGDFVDRDRQAARNFGIAARESGVERIVYLGGLGDGKLSSHLASRQEVGRVLRESGVVTVELRASIIIGSGSLLFEMIRSLVDKLAVMITPRWVNARAQPIAVEDVIEYLLAAREVPLDGRRVFEIGGADIASYREIMLEYARQRGLKRRMIAVPALTPWLSSLWLGLVTPVYARVGRKLIDSIRCDTVVKDPAALEVFRVRPLSLAQAVERALANEDREFAETRWSDALSSYGGPRSWGGVRFGSRLVDARCVEVDCPPERAFAPVRRIGGRTGWYYANWLWRIRGALDLLAGGPGLRRGRRTADEVWPGETLDFWRVEAFEPNRLLRLRAEMKTPGRAWLQFEVEPSGQGSRIVQTALFDPAGLAGLLYWYGLYPVHRPIFDGMLRSCWTRRSRAAWCCQKRRSSRCKRGRC